MLRGFVIAISLLSLAALAFAQYAVIYRLDGDRLTGRWMGADGSSVRIRLQDGNQIRVPIEQIQAIEFLSKAGMRPGYEAFKRYRNGLDFLELGMVDEARRQFMEAIREMPKFPDPYYELAKLLEREGKTEEAFRYYGLVAMLAPERYNMADKFKAMAETYLQENQIDKAAEAYYRLYTCFPGSPDAEEAIYNAGFLFAERLDSPDKAVQSLKGAVQSFPENPQAEKAQFMIGKLLIKLGRYEEAVAALTDFINRYPQSEWLDDAHFARGEAYHEMRRHQEALEEFNLVKNTSPDANLISEAARMISESAWEVYTISDGLPANEVQALALDGSYLWVGTSKGIAKFDISEGKPSYSPDTPELKGINIRALAVNDAEVWIGTLNSGIIRLDKETGARRDYTMLDGLPSKHITDIKLLGDEVWVATFGGVATLDRASDTWVKYTTQDGLSGNDAVSIAITQEAVWVATSMNGLNMFDKGTKTWTAYTSAQDLPSDSIRSVVANEMSVWIGWYGRNRNGYGKYDLLQNKWYSTTLMVDDITPVEDIFLTLNGEEFWVATDAGAFVELPVVGWDSINYPSKLSGARINCMLVSGAIAWFGTSEGLGRLDYGMLKQLRSEGY
jgi:TolA-binding protein